MTDEKYRHPERSVGSDIFNLSRVAKRSISNKATHKQLKERDSSADLFIVHSIIHG